MNPDILGYLAGTCIAIATVPQLYKTLNSKQTRDLALNTPVYLALGSALFIAYGLLIQAWPLVVSNTIAFVINTALVLAILVF